MFSSWKKLTLLLASLLDDLMLGRPSSTMPATILSGNPVPIPKLDSCLETISERRPLRDTEKIINSFPFNPL